MNLKKTFLFIHRWLGLISGLVVFIVSVTGCLFCFQDELQDAFHHYRKVGVQRRPYVPPSMLKEEALRGKAGGSAAYVYYYGPDRPCAVLVNTGKAGMIYVYLDPYSGKITHTENPNHNFFTVVEYIHLYLLLPPKIGGWVVGISVAIFILVMITGIVLWWPKRKTDRRRSFRIKWGSRWKRINYDLHNVLGFYVTSIALILAFTGLSIAFDPVRQGVYTAVNLGRDHPREKLIHHSDALSKVKVNYSRVIDKAFAAAQRSSPLAAMFLIYDDAAQTGTIGITAYARSLHFYNSDAYEFDKYTGRLINFLPQHQKSAGLKMNEMNYDIHVGQILGISGKIIAFLASLICASLPVSGLIIWLGKRNKSKSKKTTTRIATTVNHPPAVTGARQGR